MIVKKLSHDLIAPLADAFSNWPKPKILFEQYLEEQQSSTRDIWVALKDDTIAGYITVKWQSDYEPFKQQQIPEINDLNVLPHYRNQGIGSQLLDVAEKEALQKSDTVGLGVGLYADYGAAQRLYIQRGYIPNGKGITYNYKDVAPGESVTLDDNLILWLIKGPLL